MKRQRLTTAVPSRTTYGTTKTPINTLEDESREEESNFDIDDGNMNNIKVNGSSKEIKVESKSTEFLERHKGFKRYKNFQKDNTYHENASHGEDTEDGNVNNTKADDHDIDQD
jgi:hypothetical protein